MQKKNDNNIILFPKWKEQLESESLQALQAKQYDKALAKLDELISYQITNHEIFIGKLICLIELAKYEDAEKLCEYLIEKPDEHYYHYLHIYLTILFQTNQFRLLMDYVDHELELTAIPSSIREQIEQLYHLSAKMKQDLESEKIKTYEQELQKAFETESYQTQWRIIEAMRKIHANPKQEWIYLLKKDKTHPVIKTSILHWLQALNETKMISVHKFGSELEVKPVELPTIESHFITQETMRSVDEFEQSNPSLHQIIYQLLYRYLYVKYPFFPFAEDVFPLAEACQHVGKKYMSLPDHPNGEMESKVRHYIEEIELFQTLYLSIIEE